MIKRLKRKLSERITRYGKLLGLDLHYFVQSGFWVGLRQGLQSLAGLVFYIVFIRLVSKEVFGNYQLILSLVAVIYILSVPGLNTAVLRSAAKGLDGDYLRAARKSFLWSLAGIPTLIAVGLYFYFYRDTAVGYALMGSSFLFPFLFLSKMRDNFLQGKRQFKTIALANVAQTLMVNAALIIAVLLRRDSLIVIALVYFLMNVVSNLIFYKISWKFIENKKTDPDAIKYGFFLTKLNIMGVIAANIDKVLTGIFLSAGQLATYSVGILFTSQIQNITNSLLGVAAPKYVVQKRLSRGKYIRIFGVSILLMVVFLFGFRFVIPILFQGKYDDSIILSIISVVFYPFFVISQLYRNQFLFTNKRVVAGEAIIYQIFKITSSVIVLPLWGITGMAFIYGFQYVVVFLSLFILGSIFKDDATKEKSIVDARSEIET